MVEEFLIELGYRQIAETEHDKSFASFDSNEVHKIELHHKLFDVDSNSYDNTLTDTIWGNINYIDIKFMPYFLTEDS